MKNISSLSSYLFFLCVILHFSCTKSDEPKRFKINENIDTLLYENMYGIMNVYSSYWFDNNRVYTSHRLGYYQLNSNLKIIQDSLVEMHYYNLIVSALSDGNKYLFIKSIYDVSIGPLCEYNTNNNHIEMLIDSTENVSSAVYYRTTDQIIYYSYGNPIGVNPGYYLFNKVTNEKILLLEYISDVGPAEFINGFDVHPREDIIIIPVVRMGYSPLVVEYNFNTKTSDTLQVNFDFSINRICLWLRYNKTGDQILYSNYPRGAGGHTTNDDSEVGILDRKTLTKRILDVNTAYKTGLSVNIFPNWSPDEKHIIYSSAPVSYEGAKGLYGVYILKNVN
jgi:hypothetical protein